MTKEQLEKVNSVYRQLENGISIPNDIKEAYGYISDTPATNGLQMIRVINRFMTFKYQEELVKQFIEFDELIDVDEDATEPTPPPFIGDKRSVEYREYKERYKL